MKSNPFATRFVRPGQVDWIADPPNTLERLADDFGEYGLRAAIVGPHGSGKSTLLEHLVPLLGQVGWRIAADDSDEQVARILGAGPAFDARAAWVRYPLQPPAVLPQADADAIAGKYIAWLALRSSRSPLRRVMLAGRRCGAGAIMVVDGWEQLAGPARLVAIWLIRRRRLGLLATSHRRLSSVPVLFETHCQLNVARQVVGRLLDQRPDFPIRLRRQMLSEEFLSKLLREQRGNLREVLMHLYDVFAIAEAREASQINHCIR